MPHVDQEASSLRAAIAWALHLADSQEESLIAAYLADVLHMTDNELSPE